MKTITCPDCAGLGSKVTKINRGKAGRVSSVTFSLRDDCPTCDGRGEVQLMRGNIIRSLGVKAASETVPAFQQRGTT